MTYVKAEIAGTTVTPMTASEVVNEIAANSGAGKFVVVGHNLHSWYLLETNAGLKALYDRADIVLVDGFPIWALLRFCSPVDRIMNRTLRCGSTDWLMSDEFAALGLRIAVVGGTTTSAVGAAVYLSGRGSHHVVCAWNGFDDLRRLKGDNFRELHRFSPDLVLLGLGMPYQEIFLTQNADQLPDATYALVGGAIDQLSGVQPLAPRWLGRLGFEWLYRLIRDPRRLASRYIVEPVKLSLVLARKVKARGGTGHEDRV